MHRLTAVPKSLSPLPLSSLSCSSSSSSLLSHRFASTLVLADHDTKGMGSSTRSTVSAASKLGGDITVLVAGHKSQGVAEAVAGIEGVTKVVHADDAAYEHQTADALSSLLGRLQEQHKFTHILGSTSAVPKSVLPHLSAKLDVQPIADVLEIQSEDTFKRSTYAGNALATVQSSDPVKVMTVRPTAFEDASDAASKATVEALEGPQEEAQITWVSDEISESDRPDLGSAPTVVSGGRGLKSGENFEMLYQLADKMGAAVGASRAAVDAGYVPNDMQVGQTGKVVAPNLYMAFGISGAIQHLSGMKDSKTIVAVNKDPEAPIFQVADYGMVADLFTVVPELSENLEKNKS